MSKLQRDDERFINGFIQAYWLMGGEANSDEVRMFMNGDEETRASCPNYTSIMDALLMFEAGIKFKEDN